MSNFGLGPTAAFFLTSIVIRSTLNSATRVVVKLGTGVLTDSRKRIDPSQLKQLVDQVAALRKSGRETILVTSGAVGAGMGALGYSSRPRELAEKQACAAVGQSRLMASYDQLFAEHGLVAAQVLLTHDDLQHHERHLNARNTLVTLLKKGVIPIINENDAISFTEIKFGDNDRLSALVACLLPADLLVILTTVDGVMEGFGTRQARLVPVIEQLTPEVEEMAGGTTSETAVGGMKSKMDAAKIAIRSGIPLIIASGLRQNSLLRAAAGENEGTLFVPATRKMQGRKRWIAFFHHPKGSIKVDDGAKKALREQGRSLLLPGIIRCEGSFDPDEVVRLCDENGTEFARGIARLAAREIRSEKISRAIVVHRDDLVIL